MTTSADRKDYWETVEIIAEEAVELAKEEERALSEVVSDFVSQSWWTFVHHRVRATIYFTRNPDVYLDHVGEPSEDGGVCLKLMAHYAMCQDVMDQINRKS